VLKSSRSHFRPKQLAALIEGPVYIRSDQVVIADAATLRWLWLVEGQRPDHGDFIGAAVCVLAAAIILLARRG
jgi:drug/metabolite transporter superfamily protein YnfA